MRAVAAVLVAAAGARLAVADDLLAVADDLSVVTAGDHSRREMLVLADSAGEARRAAMILVAALMK